MKMPRALGLIFEMNEIIFNLTIFDVSFKNLNVKTRTHSLYIEAN